MESLHWLTGLAAFTGWIHAEMLPLYLQRLGLPEQDAAPVLQTWQAAGLLLPDPDNPDFLTFPVSLSDELRLKLAQDAQRQGEVEVAFREHYTHYGQVLLSAVQSAETTQRRRACDVIEREYENMATALQFAIRDRAPIGPLYGPLSHCLYVTRRHARAIALGNQVLTSPLSATPEHRDEIAWVTIDVGSHHLALRDYQAAEELYRRALEALDTGGQDEADETEPLRAAVYHQLGQVAEEQKRWPEAEERYHQALQLKIKAGDQHSEAATRHQLGVVAQHQRRYDLAEEHYRRALSVFTRYGKRHEQSLVYHNLGAIAQAQWRWEQAREYYQKALQIKIDDNDRYAQVTTLHQLGRLAGERQEWAEAEDYFNRALQTALEFRDLSLQFVTWHELGVVAQFQGAWERADECYGRALAISSIIRDRNSIARAQQSLGSIAHSQQQWAAALGRYGEALRLWIELHDDENGGIALQLMAHVWKKSGTDVPRFVAEILNVSTQQATLRLLKSLSPD